MDDNLEAKCECVKRDDGIYELTLKAFNISGVDAFFGQMERLYEGRTPSDPPLCAIVNSPGSLPINYAMQRGKKTTERYPNVGRVRVAIMTDNVFEARLADSFLRLLRFATIQIRFFLTTHREEACQWLLEGAGLPLQT